MKRRLSPTHYIQVRQNETSWQSFRISGGYPLRYNEVGNQIGSGVPIGTGACRVVKPTIPCLFRRSTTSHKLERRN